jgi:hypothetical protein
MKTLKIRCRFLWFFLAMGFLFPPISISGELAAKLPQVISPYYLTTAEGRIYIVENDSTAHLYSLGSNNEVAYVKTFGREGQGPGEFNFMYRIRVLDDHLDVSGLNKLARFSLDGEYIDEVKVTVDMFKGGIYRIGNNYVIRILQFSPIETMQIINLYDKDFKLIKEIGSHKEPRGFDKINLVSDVFSPRATDDKIFVIFSGKESIVTVYDQNGNQQEEILLPLEPIKLTKDLKEAIVKPLREDPQLRDGWSSFEKRIYFPDKTPGLDYFDIVDGKFIARTYKYKQDSVEFVVIDQQVQELQRIFLPYTGRLSRGILFCFYQDCYYYLLENIEEETWELHCEKVW